MLRTIIPTRSDDLIVTCLDAMERSESGSTRSVIVGDNGLTIDLEGRYPGITRVQVPKCPFIHMQALNAMIDAFDYIGGERSYDICVMGDDCNVTTPNWLTRSERLLGNWPREAGMLNFVETGLLAFGDYSHWHRTVTERGTLDTEPFYTPSTQPLAGSLIPRRVYNAVGKFDERFVGYGYDDVDYCVRILHTGMQVGLTGVAQYQHKGRVTFERELKGNGTLITMSTLNRVLFYEKWGLPIAPAGFPLGTPHLNRQSCGCGPGI